MISCPKCSAVLRRIDGLHQAGEPFMQADEQGQFMICLTCQTRVPWVDEDQPPTPEPPAIEGMRDCPHCASGDLEVFEVQASPITLAVRCKECGAQGPRSLSSDPAHAIFALNQRMGRTPSSMRDRYEG